MTYKFLVHTKVNISPPERTGLEYVSSVRSLSVHLHLLPLLTLLYSRPRYGPGLLNSEGIRKDPVRDTLPQRQTPLDRVWRSRRGPTKSHNSRTEGEREGGRSGGCNRRGTRLEPCPQVCTTPGYGSTRRRDVDPFKVQPDPLDLNLWLETWGSHKTSPFYPESDHSKSTEISRTHEDPVDWDSGRTGPLLLERPWRQITHSPPSPRKVISL